MRPRSRRFDVRWILVLPFAALLVPALYARSEPALFGFPFFYWYQFAWLGATSGLLAIADRRTP